MHCTDKIRLACGVCPVNHACSQNVLAGIGNWDLMILVILQFAASNQIASLSGSEGTEILDRKIDEDAILDFFLPARL